MSKFNISSFEVFFTSIVVIIVAFAFDILIAWPFMLLWNWLMPLIFNLPTITFLESAGLLVLSSMLFKSSNSSFSK